MVKQIPEAKIQGLLEEHLKAEKGKHLVQKNEIILVSCYYVELIKTR